MRAHIAYCLFAYLPIANCLLLIVFAYCLLPICLLKNPTTYIPYVLPSHLCLINTEIMQTFSIQSEPESQNDAKKRIRRRSNYKPIYTGELSGVKYYDYGFASYLLKKGSALTFLREPKNPYDFYAIAVWYKNWKLGYIPKNQNEILANMLDQDMPMEIRVKSIVDDWDGYGGGLEVEVLLMT